MCSKEQGEKIRLITEVDGFSCKIEEHPRYSHKKAIIYVHELDLESLDEFKAELKSNYNITDVQPVPFIKTRSPETSVFIITFQQQRLPYNIYIPGERQDTRVFEIRDNP